MGKTVYTQGNTKVMDGVMILPEIDPDSLVFNTPPVDNIFLWAEDDGNGVTVLKLKRSDGSEIGFIRTNPTSISFDLTNIEAPEEGELNWNSEDGTLQLGMPGGTVAYQLGQEELIRVRNISGSTIPNGSAVYVTGSSGNKPTIELADADLSNAHKTIGVTTEEIENNSNGFVTTLGYVRGVNTNGWAEGTQLYLSQTAGGFADSAPATPAHKVEIGTVIRQHNSEGAIFVNVRQYMDLFEIRRNLARVTDTYQITSQDDIIFANTNGGNFTITLPDTDINGQNHRIVNVGSGILTIQPHGTDNLLGENSGFNLNYKDALIVSYNPTEGWF